MSGDGAGRGGGVKILDFGLAKAIAPADAARGSDPALSASPTMTLAATMRGEILGTAAYMSPEQASGRAIDKRADIWAFGVCLYEALTGRRPFHGEDAANTLASVLRDPIDLDALPAACPLRLRRLLERCLVRDAHNRLRDIGDARIELSAIASDAASAERSGEVGLGASASSRPWIWLAAGAALGAVLSVRPRAPGDASCAGGSLGLSGPVIRSTIDLGELPREPSLSTGPVSISRDGSMLTLAAGVDRSPPLLAPPR